MAVKKFVLASWVLALWVTGIVWNCPTQAAPSFTSINRKVQTLKRDIIKLGHDLALLGGGIPVTGQELIIFVSLDRSKGFSPVSVDLMLNDHRVSHQEFTPKTIKSLLNGGTKGIFMDNLPAGQYRITATLIGKISTGANYHHSITYSFAKYRGLKRIELKITQAQKKSTPGLVVTEWD